MKRRGPIAAEVTWAQVHAFRLRRHHLSSRAAGADLVHVAGETCGLQAQVMSAAESQLAVRCECSSADVREALWLKRSLVKTWLMRGTLHLVPANDLPVYTAATRGRWMKIRKSWLTYVEMSEVQLMKLIEEIGDVMDGAPMTREEILARVGHRYSERVREFLRSGWGGLLKPVARMGLLCFGPSRNQNVTFVRPDAWLGGWRDVDPEEAIVEVARRYLSAYGPATKRDFGRWWGSWLGVGEAAWSGLEGRLANVSLEGDDVAQVLESDLDALTAATAGRSVQLLPAFDPYLMGHSDRDHLFDRAHATRVSRTAGWISAVLLVDGRVQGTWTHRSSGGSMRVNLTPFRKLPGWVTAEAGRRAQALAAALGFDQADVKVSLPSGRT